ncbi:MAG: helix-turn-helix domain-containing protein [Saprospiraceae bacterium]|nr:helix-turn-helix domain-containing protein [Saprospiraceae bacterium]
MQLQLPIFSRETKFISDCVGYYTKEGIVQYIVNGLPVFAHGEDDLNSFRYIVSNFIDQGLCKKVEVQRAFHVSDDSIYRYCKLYKEKGADGFFGERPRSKRRSHKMVGETTLKIQKEIDKGRSVNSIAKEFGISEWYHPLPDTARIFKKRIIKP